MAWDRCDMCHMPTQCRRRAASVCASGGDQPPPGLQPLACGEPARSSAFPTHHSIETRLTVLYLLNSSVIPSGSNGIWEVITIETESAKINLRTFDWISAVGHDSTAQVMSEVLGTTVRVNRIQVSPESGDRLLCFKLKGRAPEGVVLDKQQLEKIGYEWILMIYHRWEIVINNILGPDPEPETWPPHNVGFGP